MVKNDEAASQKGRKACCLVSGFLEEMGLDSRKAREIRRQTLVGLITFCQWQLSRIDDDTSRPKRAEPRKTKGRRVKVV